MNKQILKAVFCGAVVLSAGVFTSCNNDEIDELRSKVGVIESAIDDIKKQLGNALMTGASVTSVTQDENTGAWTITLSNNQVIEIGAGGGGSNISVVVTDNEAIITIDGEEYRLPLGSSVTSLIYSPQTVDGIVNIGNDGAEVQFLVRPALSNIEGAEFSIAESHEVTNSRASDGEQFKVKNATLEGEFIKISLKALSVTASKYYAVSLQMKYKGTIIGSNYFNVKVSDDFSFKAEDLVDPVFADPVTDAAEVSGKAGFWTATIPVEKDFVGTFDFKELVSLPEKVNIEFTLGKKDDQNSNVLSRYDFFKSCLSPDGKWTMTERPGTNCSKDKEDTNPDGLLIYLKVDDVIKSKIYWKINDPLAGADFSTALNGLTMAHLEYGEPAAEGEGKPIIVEVGKNNVNIVEMLLTKKFSIQHDGGKLTQALGDLSVDYKGESVFYANGSNFAVSEDFMKKYAKLSRGLYWYNAQASIAASNRRNWENLSEEEKNKYNGEIISGWDGLSADDMIKMGLGISPDGTFVTTSNYGGWAVRMGVAVDFEYDYGRIPVSNGPLAFIWINRRECPLGVEDPAAR